MSDTPVSTKHVTETMAFHIEEVAGRTLMKLTGIKPESENNVNVSALNGIFGKVFSSERLWLKNFDFPFGVSIVIVARKPEADTSQNRER